MARRAEGIRSAQEYLQSLHPLEQTRRIQRILAEFIAKRGEPEQLTIDAIHLKAHRTAASLQKRGCSQTYLTHQRRPELSKLHAVCDGHGWPAHPASKRRADERL